MLGTEQQCVWTIRRGKQVGSHFPQGSRTRRLLQLLEEPWLGESKPTRMGAELWRLELRLLEKGNRSASHRLGQIAGLIRPRSWRLRCWAAIQACVRSTAKAERVNIVTDGLHPLLHISHARCCAFRVRILIAHGFEGPTHLNHVLSRPVESRNACCLSRLLHLLRHARHRKWES